jgi:beta-glucosidase
VDKRVDALLGKMTLPEKIGQMTQLSDPSKEHEGRIRRGEVGSLLNVTKTEDIARFQKIAKEESRLGIPIIFGYDVIHGMRTIFPIPLAEAASWDVACMERASRVSAREAAATGIHWTFGPMVDIARDARWGRIAEGSGEDAFLTSAMARAYVRGFQGEGLSGKDSLATCAKHYVAYGAAEGGRDYHTVDMSERTLREVYLPPFKAAIDEGCPTVMSSFNEIGGIPASLSPFTLRQILKKEWGFDGFVLSDWDAVGQTVDHGCARDRADAALLGVQAGVDMDMTGQNFPLHLAKWVREKKLSIKMIDDAVRRILRVKLELDLFERPLPAAEREREVHLAIGHRQAALELARRSMVLLKNDRDLLPLSKETKSIAVIGPLADNRRDPLGVWSGIGQTEDVVTVLTGVRKIVAPNTDVRYARGCDIDGDVRTGFPEAVRTGAASDVIVAVLGEGSAMSGEGHSRADIGLPGPQLDLLKFLHATGKPIVLVLMNGRPMSLPWEKEHVPSILVAWHLGITAGTAIAEALFGDVNPSGKLPATFPRSAGHCPIYYNIKPSGRPKESLIDLKVGYVDSPMEPLYPFGHGLGYAPFVYSELAISPGTVRIDGKLEVSVVVKNAGEREGEEVVQLYVRDPVASTTRPVKELKGFQRVLLAKGESKRVTFELTAASLAFYDDRMKLVVEPGTVEVWVGGSSQGGLGGRFEIVGRRTRKTDQ